MRHFILFWLCFFSFLTFADHKGLGVLDYSERTFPCESYAEAERLMEEEGKPEHYYIYAVCQFHRGEISQGIELMRELAEWGDVKAQHFLGKMYLRGREVRESARRAFFWIHMAAISNHHPSQYILGTLYRDGRGVERNEELGDLWIQKVEKQQPSIDKIFDKNWHNLRQADREPPNWIENAKENTQPLIDEVRRWFEQAKDTIGLSSIEVGEADE